MLYKNDKKYQICHHQIRFFSSSKSVFGRGSAPDPAGGAYDAPPDPVVGRGGVYSVSNSAPTAPRFSGPLNKILATSVDVTKFWKCDGDTHVYGYGDHDRKSSPPAAISQITTVKIHANALAAGAMPRTPLVIVYSAPQTSYFGEGGMEGREKGR